jgi:hypothetical protein
VNQARVDFGLPAARQVLAEGRNRERTFAPSSRITAILCAGATSAALQHALQSAPRPGLVMFLWGHHQHGDAASKEVTLIERDAGIPPRVVSADSSDPEDLETIINAGVIYLPGGWAEESFGHLVDTPLLQAISSSVEAGAILVGNSGGAMVLGAGRLSRWESGDVPEPLPLLGWLDELVIGVHIRDRKLDPELRANLSAFSGRDLLGIGQAGAVMVRTQPLELFALASEAGNESVFLASADGEPETVSPMPAQ